MRSINFTAQTAVQPAGQPFAIQTGAESPVIQFKIAVLLFLTILTMAAAGLLTLHPSNASQAEGLNSLATQGLATTKSDRIASAPARDCTTQAWGAWSEDCAAALTGAARVRSVSYVTVAKTKPTANETILARYPVR